MSATAEVTGGSVANFQLLGAGRVGMVFGAGGRGGGRACAARGRFRGRAVPARAIAVLYTNRMQVVTTAATGIRSMADLQAASGFPPARRVRRPKLFAFRVIAAAGPRPGHATSARANGSAPAESTNAIKRRQARRLLLRLRRADQRHHRPRAPRQARRLVLVDHDRVRAPAHRRRRTALSTSPEVIPANTYPGQARDEPAAVGREHHRGAGGHAGRDGDATSCRS